MSVPYYGDFAEDDTVLIPFNTFSSNDPSASVTVTTLIASDIKVHKDGGTTEIATDGATIAINFDSRTGAHLITIDTSAHSDYSTGSEYAVMVEGATVDGGNVTAWVGAFSIERAGGALALTKLIQAAVITNAAGADVAADIIAVKAETATILTDTGTTLQGELDAIQAAVITNAAGTDIAADIIAVKAETANILTDTGTTLENRLIAIEADTDVIDDGTSGLVKIASDVAAVLVDTGTTIPGTITTMQGNVTDILTDTGTTLQAELDGIQADTEDLQTQIGTAGAGLTDLGGMSTGMMAEVEAEALDALEGVQLDHLVGVTTGVAADGDLTTYCVDGSVMSHIMTGGADTSDYNASTDALEVSGGGDATEAKQDSIIAAVITNAAGADIAADIIAVKAETANILTDTGTTLQGELDGIQADTEDIQTQIGAAGAGLSAIPWNASWDAEVQSECADALTAYDPPTKAELDAAQAAVTLANGAHGGAAASITLADYSDFTGAAASNPNVLQSGTITVTDQTHFTLNAGSADDDAYLNMVAVLEDAATATQKSVRTVTAYTGATKTVTIDSAPDFTIVTTDKFDVLAVAPGSTPPTASVIADAVWDEDQVDHVAVGTFGITASEIADILADSSELQADWANGGRLDLIQDAILDDTDLIDDGNSGLAKIATDVAAVLVDTGTTIPGTITTMQGNVTDILTDTGTTLQAELDGIQADTEDLQTQIGAAGAGLSAVPWNSAWDAEVQSECTDALNAYDPPTKAEMDTGHGLLATEAKQDIIDTNVDQIETTVITNAAGVDIAADIIAIKTETAAIVADTNELQVDDTPGALSTISGKIDTIDGVVDTILVDTGDMQPRVAAIEVDTGTTLQGELDGIQTDTEDIQAQIGAAGAGLSAVPWNASWDAEVQSECADALTAYDPPTKAELDAAQAAVSLANGAHGGAAASITLADYSDFTGAGATNPNVLLTSEIATVTNQTTFTLVSGSDIDSAYDEQSIVLYDDTNSDYPSVRTVSSYTGATKTVVIDSGPDFTLGDDDSAKIFVTPGGSAPSAATVADAVWNEDQADHVAAGTFGVIASEIASIVSGTDSILSKVKLIIGLILSK